MHFCLAYYTQILATKTALVKEHLVVTFPMSFSFSDFFFFFSSQAFNKNNLILEERNKYFNPHLTAKTYSNTYFTDFNNYDEY